MAKQVELVTAGTDVCLDDLDIHRRDTDELVTISNDVEAITEFLSSLPPAQIAVEPTNTYHELFVELAIKMGHVVYLIDPGCVNKYRDAIASRVKNDAADARLLSRYLERENADLTPYRPLCKQGRELMLLLNRRALIVKHRTSLSVGLRDLPALLKHHEKKMKVEFDQLIKRIDKRMQALIDTLGYREDFNRVKAIHGFGELNAIALVTLYHQHTFARADQFIAFIGFDVRVRDSGTYKGRRKLTKKGPSEVRRLLYMGAQAASRSTWMKPVLERLLKQGKPKIAAKCIIARKLARIAFSIMKNKSEFSLEHHKYA